VPVLFLFSCFNSGSKSPAPDITATQVTDVNKDSSVNTLPSNTTTLDAASDGGTITFQNIGTVGWYPSVRDPASGSTVCDAGDSNGCCRAKHYLTNDSLTPWNEDLIMTLRGPMIVKQVAVYQPAAPASDTWTRTSMWDSLSPSTTQGIAFSGNAGGSGTFAGVIGNTCLVNVSTNSKFPNGPGSVPYCPASAGTVYYGWSGSKMIIVQAYMPRMKSGVIATARHCGVDTANNWYDAPWIGLSHGEMVRIGAFGSCQCYAKDPSQWWLADGCGQFNAFEVVNDNNSYQNFDLFSTNFFGYGGYVGEGPCGTNCTITGLDPKADLINKSTGKEAATGAISNPTKGPGAAFRRPENGYRFFVMLFDIKTRQVQLALIHPGSVPATVQAILPGLPAQVNRTAVDNILSLRLPATTSTAVIR
jgi:hypothetical protein